MRQRVVLASPAGHELLLFVVKVVERRGRVKGGGGGVKVVGRGQGEEEA
jgi:hypothetical protein